MVRRVVVAGCFAVLAAAALAGCKVNLGGPVAGGPAPVAIPSPSSPSPSSPPAGGTGGGVATTPSHAPVPACPASALTLAQVPGDDGAAGTIVVRVRVTNTSSRACTVRGYPAFNLNVLLTVPMTIEHGGLGGPFASPVTTVRLAPHGGSAGFYLAYSNRTANGNGPCAMASRMHLRLPGQATPVSGPVQIEVCEPTLRVSAFVRGSDLTR